MDEIKKEFNELISEHAFFTDGFPEGSSCLGKWIFQEPIRLFDGDWIEYRELVIRSDGSVLETLRYRVCRDNGDVGEWQDMIIENE